MDLSTLSNTLQQNLGGVLPGLLGALVILIVGWVVAIVVRAVLRRVTGSLGINERVSSSGGAGIDVESGIAKGGYWIVLLLTLVAFFDALDLELVSAPVQSLVERLLAFLPNLLAGGVLLLVAVLLATVVRSIARSALGATTLDERLSREAGMTPVSENLASILYWLILLLFLPAILGAFQITGLLRPVESMVNEALAILPNVVAAAVIGVVGWLVARMVRDIVSNLLEASGIDRVGENAGLRGVTLSRLVGLIVYILILVPALTAALQALEIEAITAPATAMLAAVMSAIPNVFAAAVILGLAYFIARTVSGLVSDLLAGAGFDRLPAAIGLERAFDEQRTPSRLVGTLLLFFVMLFASVEAANRMGFEQVSTLVATFIEFGGQVLLGSVIIAVGFWLSGLAHDAIARVYGDRGRVIAGVARFAIVGLVLAMGLRAMGLADDIVNLAFGLTLGAVAVAAALAFGLGGRDPAGRQLEHWFARMRGE